MAAVLAVPVTASGGTASATPARGTTGCNDPEGAAIRGVDVTVNGVSRTALVHRPPTATLAQPLPVVLSFHGTSSSAAAQRRRDGLTAKADEEGFIAVHPQGVIVDLSDEITDVTGWDVRGRAVDEPAFVTALLDELARATCIDPSRVYATGFSNGGTMAIHAACSLPSRIVAAAPVAAGTKAVPCADGGTAAMVAFYGTRDRLVRYDGSREVGTPPVEQAMRRRAKRNGCAAGPAAAEVTPTVQRFTWHACDADTVMYRLERHGHAWPGIPQAISREQLVAVFAGDGDRDNPVASAQGLTPEEMADNVLLTNTDINATDVMWEFFERVTRAA
jgi:polyhydroxybutyrate depolymerase